MMHEPDATLVAIWTIANLATGLAYLHIPYEMLVWRRRTRLSELNWVLAIFTAFIVACGMHHIVMLRFAGVHPLDVLQVSTDAIMGVVSVAASWLLHRLRGPIISAIRAAITDYNRP